MTDMMFCPRCGHVAVEAFLKSNVCSICKSDLVKAPFSGETWFQEWSDEQRNQWIDEHMIHDDQTKVYIDIRERSYAENDKRITRTKQEVKEVSDRQKPHIPHCPICGSADLKKLSTVGKAAKIGIFGIFGMGDVGKTYKCNNCGSKF